MSDCNSAPNKMLEAYCHFLQAAKSAAFKAEQATWETLSNAIDQAEEKVSALETLTAIEVAQVQEDVKADLVQLAEALDTFEEDAKSFIEMEWELLEGYLAQAAKDMADPTTMMILRMRLMAVAEKERLVQHS